MSVVAKMKCNLIHDFGTHKVIHLAPVYSPDKNSPNYSWSQATPSGEIKLTITNPDAFNRFKVTKDYLVTFEETT